MIQLNFKNLSSISLEYERDKIIVAVKHIKFSSLFKSSKEQILHEDYWVM